MNNSMAHTVTYDPDEHLFSPSPDVAYRVLSDAGSPDIFDLSSTDTKSGIYPSQNNSNSSPRQLTPYSPTLSLDDFGVNFLDDERINFSSMIQPTEKLHILAQPKAFYRERYCSETDPSKHRAQRFIRSDDDLSKHEYPTIQIPMKWRDPNRSMYIRVTLVTSFSDTAPAVCIHPYAIDTQETDVLRDSTNNSLYFPLNKEDIVNGEKSFRISRKKMIQHDLRSYGTFRLFDLNQNDIQRVMNIHDAKQIIDTYQLWKSQLVFTIAERLNKNLLPAPIISTSVTSQIMFDEASGRRKEPLTNKLSCLTTCDEESIKCTPRKGDWSGGDEILMVVPKLDRRKIFNIYFDYGQFGILGDIQVSFVDNKTIFFQTPPCQLIVAERNLTVPIIVTQNDVQIAYVDFVYLTPNKTKISLCSRCEFDLTNNHYIGNKRLHHTLEDTHVDGGDKLVEQMKGLTTEEVNKSNHQSTNDATDGDTLVEQMKKLTTEEVNKSNHRSANDDSNAKFDKYLNQLQEAVVEFVRTNNPSRLFRRTRLLLSKCDENPPPLDDAIRHGHIDLALKLIEQISDMSPAINLLERKNDDGEIPLLLSAKLNHWILIEAILKKRLDLSEKIDKSDNNIFHLLANISDDKSYETILNLVGLLPDNIKKSLLKKKNKDNQLPIDIAQIKNNTKSIDLLK